MNNLTIGYLPAIQTRKGAQIKGFDTTEVSALAQKATSKLNLPALYVYQGVKGEYSSSNVFFMDIDTTECVDRIIEGKDELFAKVPFVYALQKSASGKLHIICIHNETFEDVDSWSYNTILYSIAVCRAINAIFGVDYLESKAIDLHQSKFTQGLFFSKNELVVNEYAMPDRLNPSDVILIKQKYPEYFEEISSNFTGTGEMMKDVDIDFNAVVGKLTIDRNYTVGKYNGNDLRWRIGSYLVCTYGKEQAQVIVDKLFENAEEFTFYNKGINPLIKTWFENIFPFIQAANVEKQEKNRLSKVEMKDDKYMSDYVNEVERSIAKEQILTISAPTGTGKTTMLEKLTKKYHKKAIILVPFNVTNQLYRWSNVVSSATTNKFLPGQINTMIWDQFIKNYKEIEQSSDIIFVDESHTLFLDRSYRDSAVGVWAKFQTWIQLGKKIVFVSATPAGEIAKLNSRVLKFVKNDKRNVKVNILCTNDTLTALEQDLHNKEYDRVCVFSDRDVKILYARLCIKGEHADSKIYHSQWPKNVEELKTTERLTARMNLLTCIAFNGLNIKNADENICVSVRHTEGVTTLNELIQIVGRFRDNKNITLNIYVDNKYTTFEDLDELFANAKAITDYESNEELKSEYYERLASGSVQDSLREIDAYEKMWTLGNIIREMKSRYPVEVVNKVFDKEHMVKRTNPIKKQASDLFVDFLSGKIDEETFNGQYVNTDMEDFINGWRREMNNIMWQVGEKVGIVDAIVAECEKQNTLIDNAIKKIKHIIWIVGMDEPRWNAEVTNREGLKGLLKGATMIKRAMAQFKKDDEIRVKYAEYIYSDRDVSETLILDPEALFRSVVTEINGEKEETFNKRSNASSQERRKHLYRCVESGEEKTKPEWIESLDVSKSKFNYLVMKGLYVKE